MFLRMPSISAKKHLQIIVWTVIVELTRIVMFVVIFYRSKKKLIMSVVNELKQGRRLGILSTPIEC